MSSIEKTPQQVQDNHTQPGIINELPKKANQVEVSSFEGPLPHPQIIYGYEKVVSGSADRIIKMAENNQAHRITWEKNALNASISSTKRSQWMGFGLSLVAICAATFLAINDAIIVGSIIAIFPVYSIIRWLLNYISDK